MRFLVDHMWQSLQVIGCLAFFAFLTRHNSARFRVWLWRAAALKLLLPLQWLCVIGSWAGFPVPHSADPPPPGLVRLLHDCASWFAPARQLESGTRWLTFAALSLGLAIAMTRIIPRMRSETLRAADERRRLEQDPDDRPPGVGFVISALLSAWTLVLLSGPVLSGAIDDRLRRQEQLRRNELALHDATVIVRPAARGMGSRLRVAADERGITIRNATLREIGGLAYGVSVYMVRGQHFIREGEEDWLTGPRYDVRVTGRAIDPQEFDTYALREPLTRALATQYGLEIYEDGKCQPPCGRWGSYVLPPTAIAPSVGVPPSDEVQLSTAGHSPVE